MGFEQRRSVRIKGEFPLYFWPGASTEGPGEWAHAVNLSETGMAFVCPKEQPAGQGLTMEFSLPGQGSLDVGGTVVASQWVEKDRHWHVRVRFDLLEGEAKQRLEAHVLQVSDPKLAAVTGWGKVYFEGQSAMEVKYRVLPPELPEQWLEIRTFLSVKELGYLKNFKAYVEHALGEHALDGFRLLGGVPLKTAAPVWVELALAAGPLQCLAETRWCEKDGTKKAEAGLKVLAFQKDAAMRIEKLGL